MNQEEKQIIEDYFQDCEYIIGQDEIGGLLDKINQLLKTRQEKMVKELDKQTRYTVSSMCCGEDCYMEETDSGEYVKIEDIKNLIKV